MSTTSTTRFAADYAKRVAGCKKCKLQLPKGEMRLAKIIPNYFVQNTEGPPPDMKQYYHPHCLFEMFFKARANTKVVESSDDIEGFEDLKDEDKEVIVKFIGELDELRAHKEGGTTKKSPKKAAETSSPAKSPSSTAKTTPKKTAEGSKSKEVKEGRSPSKKKLEKVALEKNASGSSKQSGEPNEDSKYNSFHKFAKLCDVIASVSKYTDKSAAVKMFISRDDYNGDMLTLIRLLLPGVDQRVYNIKEKQIIKHFAMIYDFSADELLDSYKNSGDVSKTVRDFIEKNNLSKVNKGNWSIQKVDRWLDKLTEFSKDEEQITHLKFAAKRLSPLEIQYLLRLIMKDLRINAGVKHILEGLHSSAYEAFQNCRDLAEIVERCKEGNISNVPSVVEVSIRLGTPVLPMLAEPCKSVEQAMKRCVNGMFAEIKYDGERVQVHKSGSSYSYYSRSLKPVQHHKISHLENSIPKAFPKGVDLILDAEVLLVDNATGKPLPFGTLGVHKKEKFKDASVCLFVFDILLYNNEDLMMRPLSERKKLLESQMTEIKNHDNGTLKTMIWKAIDEGLEGLVLKDTKSIYEPGKRHWLKVKKDYLEDGRMADTADLIVLGAYYGTGNKGGIMSVFLMGVYDSDSKSYRTVTKCGNGHSDEDLDAINKDLEKKVSRIDCDYDRLPKWLRCSRSLVPDFVVVDPKNAPVWEITGAEFSKSDKHTADGISIRFPRVTRIRNDKDWKTATSLSELKKLYECSKTKSDIDHSYEDETPLYAKKVEEQGDFEKAEELNAESMDADDECSTSNGKNRDTEDASLMPPKKKPKKEQPEQCPAGKTPCKYGADCYRKNKDHKAEFWHPSQK
ncbi:DNA ligase 3 [Parelaphostrongylus tenuis]|uniref:DNA ligase n=1 Tax=Parelaphostrongylus tenuis TaxID=148309 RepID=A0AAD5QYD3_PARTN|nr:DNA ligase 3 [Parelaphostrongylus tenuis]